MESSAVVDPLIVAISSRALFDLEDSHALFEREGLEAYARFQRLHEDDLLSPGIAFPLVRKLLALNEGCPPGQPRVEVILLSRNSSDTGLRIFNSIEHHKLGIVRAVFTSGAPVYPYIVPFGAHLFLSANPESVRRALEANVAAATILPSKAPEHVHDREQRPGAAGEGEAREAHRGQRAAGDEPAPLARAAVAGQRPRRRPDDARGVPQPQHRADHPAAVPERGHPAPDVGRVGAERGVVEQVEDRVAAEGRIHARTPASVI